MTTIRTTQLTRRFDDDVVAVDRLDLDIQGPGVVGLVGPNGSGKSTLIRMLLGLVRPTSGQATVFGIPIARRELYLSRVGALVEAPAFIPGLSAHANLRSLAHLRRIPGSRVDEVLGIVGLTGREREPVKRFSLGMNPASDRRRGCEPRGRLPGHDGRRRPQASRRPRGRGVV